MIITHLHLSFILFDFELTIRKAICSLLQEYVCCTHMFIYVKRYILVTCVLLDTGCIPTTVIMFLTISNSRY